MGNPKKNLTLVTQDSFKFAKFLAKNAFDSMPHLPSLAILFLLHFCFNSCFQQSRKIIVRQYFLTGGTKNFRQELSNGQS